MNAYADAIRKISRKILEDKTVDMVIGFEKGSVPGMSKPCLIENPEDTDKLIWDTTCRQNLANYLTNRKEKIGIVAKGCDSRNIVNHILEMRIKRDQLFIIGVPCSGMTDIDGKIQDNCAGCMHRNPVICDQLAGALLPEKKEKSPDPLVNHVESLNPDERYRYLDEVFSSCSRCYACRNACPLCYCPTCFVDESDPQWVLKGDDPVDVRTYHMMRALHCAGRCTDCGACEAACPMNIPVRLFTSKLNSSCMERYGWEAGLTLDKKPAMETFSLDDPEEFIK